MIYSYTTLNRHYKNSLMLERLHHAGEAWGFAFLELPSRPILF